MNSDNVDKVETMPTPSNIERFAGINLKIKRPFKVREGKHLFEINKNCYLEHTDSGKSPYSFLIRRQRQCMLMRRGRGTITSIEGRQFYWCR